MRPMNREELQARSHILDQVEAAIKNAEGLKSLLFCRQGSVSQDMMTGLTQLLGVLKMDLQKFLENEGPEPLQTMLLGMAHLLGASQMCGVFLRSCDKK
jgi:hypothetical protein